jgi:hypothetical protein
MGKALDGNRKRHGNLAWAGMALMAGVLVSGLTAAPLTVVCIPADGRVIIELLGQDPCRHPDMHSSGHHRAQTASGKSDPADPCHDLFLDHPGLTQCRADLHGSPQSGTDALRAAAMGAGGILPSCRLSILFKLAREPEREASDSSMPLSLRI